MVSFEVVAVEVAGFSFAAAFAAFAALSLPVAVVVGLAFVMEF